MATNKSTFQFTRNFHPDVVCFDGYVSIAADASVVAPATNTDRSVVAGTTCVDDSATVAKNGTGQYEVTLVGAKYKRLRSCTAQITFNGSPGVYDVVLKGDNVNLSTAKGSQKLVFVIRNDSHVAADPSVALGFYFQARLENR